VAFFCDRANETLYASKLYLRRTPGASSTFQVVAERACLLGCGDLLRLADEFDLLVTEYLLMEEKLGEVVADDDPYSQARRVMFFDAPVAVDC